MSVTTTVLLDGRVRESCDHVDTQEDYKIKQQSAAMIRCTHCKKVWVMGVSPVAPTITMKAPA